MASTKMKVSGNRSISVRLATAQVADDCHSILHVQKNRCHILAGNARIDCLNLTNKSLCFAEQESDHVKKVSPDIREDELPEVTQKRLVSETPESSC